NVALTRCWLHTYPLRLAAIPCVRRCALTIRSSGPLRRVALLSCGGQQRPLNSSVSLVINVLGRACLLALSVCGTSFAIATQVVVVFQLPDYPVPGQAFSFPGGV